MQVSQSLKSRVVTEVTTRVDFDSRDFDDPYEAVEELRCVFRDLEPSPQPVVLALLSTIGDLTLPEMLIATIDAAGSVREAPSIEVLVASEDIVNSLSALLNARSTPPRRFRLKSPEATFEVLVANIAEVNADVVVNASNNYLRLGSGVSGAIKQRTRPTLQVELDRLASQRGIDPGCVVITGSHGLPRVRYIVHASTASGGKGTVGFAVTNTLAACARARAGSVAFPALGAGTGRLPIEQCAEAMLRSLVDAYMNWGREEPLPKRVALVLENGDILATFVDTARSLGFEEL